MLKAAIKHAHDEDKIRHRVIPQEVVQKWTQKIEEMKNEISEILQEEKEEKQVNDLGAFDAMTFMIWCTVQTS